MEVKNYIGTSRPLGEYNKTLLTIIERNLLSFNADKRKGIVTVEHYVDGGDQWRILIDEKEKLCGMTIEQLYYAVAAICVYTYSLV
jgi:hypothetical protein